MRLKGSRVSLCDRVLDIEPAKISDGGGGDDLSAIQSFGQLVND